mmetsp:Transcript_20783/g.29885  ORF Transcript_20783/g.29885 Transcript_20783/m.29885 type:complete len:796 (-) Transcript_20783:131-2518(-)|eukprot:CAMPEP_0185027296 /NCGR_PEP_ID=MMETSP1103-20130426/12146_1 /TAXON_ID=36769 /ORGANISM="Paraphysomonas bandaiensis, Strain Caron Lab Isolate" /LENGTH=795 /DNA_ID=CAMNT_0027561223 /DNA_START=186 /DNA_END=2573 /DNA_ORIENTATION=-
MTGVLAINDLIISLAYFWITFQILVLALRSRLLNAFLLRNVASGNQLLLIMVLTVMLLFSLFIFACGLTHFADFCRSHWNMDMLYFRNSSMQLCAVVSFLTAVVATFLFPAILKITDKLELTAGGELIKVENKLLHIIDSCQESIAILTMDLCITKGNASTRRIFGSRIEGCKITEIIHPDDIETFVTAASPLFESVAPDDYDIEASNIYLCDSPDNSALPVNVEFRIKDSKHNDSWRWMESTLVRSEATRSGSSTSIIGNATNENVVSGTHDVMILTRDIHTRKTEDDSRRLAQEKENLAKLQYITCCAHDLKTPLQSFSFALELLKDSGLTEDQLQLCSQARVSVSLMNLTISQTMDISKVIMGYSLKPRKSTMNLCSMMHKVAVIIEGYCRQVPITFYISNKVFNYIITDEEWVWQMLLNLLTNACKYTEEGSIQVCCRRCEQDDNMLLFELIDTGVGVNQKNVPTLFNAYSQAQQGQNTGTGLGLYGVRIRAEGLGGSCGVLPNKPKGSIFWFKIPYVMDPSSMNKSDVQADLTTFTMKQDISMVKSADGSRIIMEIPSVEKDDSEVKDEFSVTSPSKHPTNRISGKGEKVLTVMSADSTDTTSSQMQDNSASDVRISPLHSSTASQLSAQRKFSTNSSTDTYDGVISIIRERKMTAYVVDDVQSIRKLLKRTLLNLGFNQVYLFENGSKALEALKDGVVDVVFMDIQMPVMSGPEAIRRLREFEATGRQRQFVCAVSANLESEVQCVGWEGFDKALSKPLDTPNILQTMEEYISGAYPLKSPSECGISYS